MKIGAPRYKKGGEAMVKSTNSSSNLCMFVSHATRIDKRFRSVTKLTRANGIVIEQVRNDLYIFLVSSTKIS